MKNTRNFLLGVIALMMGVHAFAQQTRLTNLYNYNKFALNPAYAGASGCTEVNFSHLNQWVKIEGAPTTNFFNANTRLGKNWGVGANLLIDRLGMLQQFSASGAVSYGFTIAKEHHIRLGASAGYFQVRVDPSDAIAFDAGDQIIEGGVQTANSVNTEAGILYQFKGLELSFATQQLLETRSQFDMINLDGFGLKRHFNAYVGYDILLNKKLTLRPNVLFRGITTSQQYDINMNVNYNDFIHGGIGYRTQVGLIGKVGVNIRKLFFIGYAYETPMANIASYSSGSHEIVLGLKFCKKDKKEIDPLVKNLEPRVDIVTVIEQITDTLVVERVDTVFIDKPTGDHDAKLAALNASEKLEFVFDKAIIEKKSYSSLESLTNILLIREDIRIVLKGHTDSQGTEAYNMKLSKDRALAVKKFIVSNGVDPSRIDVEYYGETQPIASNDTEEGRARNRRVEMIIQSE